MKKLILILTLAATIGFTGCLRDDPNVDFSHVGTIVELPYSGQGNFGSDALNFTSDTITLSFTVNVASPYPPDHDITVTVGTDLSQVATYNSTYGAAYEQFPSDGYSFSDQTVTIKAGTRLATFTVTFYKAALDPAVSFMLPITIKDASGETISGNYGTHYYHFIGNPIAGTYTWEFKRWPYPDSTTGAPDVHFIDEATFAPVNATTVRMLSGYYTQQDYILSFTNNSGVLSDFQLSLSDEMLADFDAAGISVLEGPNIYIADPIAQIYQFQYKVFNGAAYRWVVDTYYR